MLFEGLAEPGTEDGGIERYGVPGKGDGGVGLLVRGEEDVGAAAKVDKYGVGAGRVGASGFSPYMDMMRGGVKHF